MSVIKVPFRFGRGKVGGIIRESNTIEHARQIKKPMLPSQGRGKRRRVKPTESSMSYEGSDGSKESSTWTIYS